MLHESFYERGTCFFNYLDSKIIIFLFFCDVKYKDFVVGAKFGYTGKVIMLAGKSGGT
ncbi:hypothetical protein BD770DRAFT_384320 [Pilaira anomala]|nr:hypothetical protein BD770DRAFT_384320 [Pilaira anomala]